MIETSQLMKELSDKNSELGKLANAESTFMKDSYDYDESLAGTAGDFVYPESAADRPWYKDGADDNHTAEWSDDLLDNPNTNQGEIHSDDSMNQANVGDDVSAPEDSTESKSNSEEMSSTESYIDKYGSDGGRYQDMKDEGWGWNTEPPTEVHHMPAASISPLERCDGPAIVMDYEDHKKTASCGSSLEAQEYRAKQKELIEQGKFREAFQMDVDDLHDKFGDKYDEAIAKAEEYLDQLEKENKI